MKGHLRLLNIACAAKAKWRQITLQKASRESPLYFSVLGGSERGFGIFVESVEDGSKTAEAGLKRGDQVRCVWGQSGPKKWPPRKHSGLLTKYRERRRLALSSLQWTNTLDCDNVVVMLPFLFVRLECRLFSFRAVSAPLKMCLCAFQIMEINGQNFENISFSKAVDILRNNTHLSLTVKTNIFGA